MFSLLKVPGGLENEMSIYWISTGTKFSAFADDNFNYIFVN